MQTFLVLTLEAPLMSFGGVTVDKFGRTTAHAQLSQIAGLCANALGWDHGDFAQIGGLQARLRLGSRADVPGSAITDYQTVDLGQALNGVEWMQMGWTTQGRAEGREGGTASQGTHIRLRDYLADAVHTVVLALEPADEKPTFDELEAALREPARPLFIGRKPCLPSGPLLTGRVEADSVLAALRLAPRHPRSKPGGLAAWWPDGDGAHDPSRTVPIIDERDWANQVHVGRRLLRHALLDVTEVTRG